MQRSGKWISKVRDGGYGQTGKGTGWGHVSSVTSGGMHYIAQDELSNATFMYTYVCQMCGGAGEIGLGWGLGKKVSLICDEIRNSKNPRNLWQGQENVKINSPWVCDFVFYPSQGVPSFPEVTHRRRSSGYGSFQWHHRQQHPLQPHHGEQGGVGEGRYGCWHTQQDPGAATGSGWGVWTWRMYTWTCRWTVEFLNNNTKKQ